MVVDELDITSAVNAAMNMNSNDLQDPASASTSTCTTTSGAHNISEIEPAPAQAGISPSSSSSSSSSPSFNTAIDDDYGLLSEYPLVMLHGFGGGLGVFVKNIDALAARFKVFTFDGLGCGKSSRPRFPSAPELAENLFVESIEAWRKAMKIEKMILLGHSFGGYQALAYALRFPQHIKHLILADPWGFPVRPRVNHHRIPLWLRIMAGLLRPFPPFTLLRFVHFFFSP